MLDEDEMSQKRENNYVVVHGDADVSGEYIIYNPKEIINTPPYQNSTNELVKYYQFCNIRTDINITNGDVVFDFCIGSDDGLIQFWLWGERDNIAISINEGFNAYSVIRWDGNQNKILFSFGDRGSLKKGVSHSARIGVKGNSLYLYINNVMVINYTLPMQGGGLLSISLHGSEQIKIKKLEAKLVQKKAFIVMQFGKEYDELYHSVIKPVCMDFDLKVVRADESYNNNFIIHEIVSEIANASVIIADITPDNPNVYYEVGYAHALNKSVVLLCNEERQRLPFDLSGFRTIFYKNTISGNEQVRSRLVNHLQSIFNPLIN